MDDAVSDGVNLLHGADDAVFRVGEGVHDDLNRLGVGGHGGVNGVLGRLAVGLVGEFAVNADTLTEALGKQGPGVGVE